MYNQTKSANRNYENYQSVTVIERGNKATGKLTRRVKRFEDGKHIITIMRVISEQYGSSYYLSVSEKTGEKSTRVMLHQKRFLTLVETLRFARFTITPNIDDILI